VVEGRKGMSEELRSDFRDLDVWKKCRDIRIMIWKLCKRFPSEEKFRLADQMIRASRSSTNNIAEGYGRFHFQENIQFCRQSRGSLFELIDHVLVAEECEYIDKEQKEKLIEDSISAIRLLNGYVKYLKMRKDKE
jgi:four helix bundle protein